MPDYVYLLESRLSADQQHALRQVRDAARDAGMILFLTGDAVRDLTSGHAVRSLEIAVHGNALKLKKPLSKMGGKVWGEDEASRSLYLCFPGTVRVDLVSTHHTEYPKPGKPAYHWASIQEDLRDRDFTANAMAISLNEGSFGLLMDPLNGVADIEARVLRLVSSYGFIEQPALLVRATRYKARLGWEMDDRTQARYQNAKDENMIEALPAHDRSQELEQIGHEDDGLKILQALEAEGWMKALFPAWTTAKADEEKLRALHEEAALLQIQGVHPDMSAAQMQLLTAKLPAKDLSALKKLMLRPGFVEEWDSLDGIAAGFQKVLLAKENQKPSASFRLFTSYDPEAVLWLGLTAKSAAVKDRYDLFLKTWPEARQRIPHALMQEMRITPELPAYAEVVHKLFLEFIDGRLNTPEEMRAFLEPFSPPAPPPQITVKRSRARRAEAKVKERSFEDEEEEGGEEEDLDDIGADDEEGGVGMIAKRDLESEMGDEGGDEEDGDDGDEEEVAAKPEKKGAKKSGKVETAPAAKEAKGGVKGEPGKTAAKSVKEEKAPAKPPAKGPAKQEPAKPAPVKSPAKAVPPAKSVAKPALKKAPEKTHSKPPVKAPVKAAAKKPAPKARAKAVPKKKTAPAQKKSAKPATKKPAAKVAKKK
ncbi:MAG TPA: hypothetical protein VKR52_01940 [Terracidiphilus sp.]|nr:hypothetical protein [Terracidiphilus sp.]